ncbi:hypothetical protein MF628_004205 [Paenibacillus polymyxa]|uniref:hypothetical protein n=1 Tax=Paenibacillus polymyxa TaxID=1406 RepID=UPI0020248FB9|nr:hypothetical protein [Paenibacillus polymyxa]URJ44479.3 hypothetical protein MF628_004205 [Paenibacillus polymyxa]
MTLNLWAQYKIDNNEKAKDYSEYDVSPTKALDEVKEYLSNLTNEENEDFGLIYRAMPANVCSLLIIEFGDQLLLEDYSFCKEVVLNYAFLPLQKNYAYQIGDGAEAAVKAIPYLFGDDESENLVLKGILLFLLLNETALGHYKRICDYAIEAINSDLWNHHPSQAKSVVSAYLEIAPVFTLYVEKQSKHTSFYEENHDNSNTLFIDFMNENEEYIEQVLMKNHPIVQMINVEIPLSIYEVTLGLIPKNTEDAQLLDTLEMLIKNVAQHIFNKSDAEDYSIKRKIHKNYSEFILSRNSSEIQRFNQYFVMHLIMNDESNNFFEELISAELKLETYENFWRVWYSFYDKVIECCRLQKGYKTDEALKTYMLAWRWWKSDAKEWGSLRNSESLFYKKITSDLPDRAIVLEGVAQILYTVGSRFIDEGINWISTMIKSNLEYHQKKLTANTIFMLENVVRRYININREKVKTFAKEREEVLVILDIIIERSSAVGYMLRERLL